MPFLSITFGCGGGGGGTGRLVCLSQSLGICQYLTVFGLEKDDSTLCCKMKGTRSYCLGHGMQGCGEKHASEIMLRPLKWLRRSDVCCAGMAVAWVLSPEPSQTKSSCGPALWFEISPGEARTCGSLNHVTDSVGLLGEFEASEKPCLKHGCQLRKTPEVVLWPLPAHVHIHMTRHHMLVKHPRGAGSRGTHGQTGPRKLRCGSEPRAFISFHGTPPPSPPMLLALGLNNS